MNSIISLFVIAFILVLIWFQRGFILGGGEAGIPFASLARYVDYTSFTWVNTSLGIPSLHVTSSNFFYIFFHNLEQMGFSQTFLQASFFWFILAFSGVGMYFLTKSFNLSKTVVMLACLFYWFNMFVIFNIWIRFQYPFIFFYSLLPIGFLLFCKGLENKKIVYVFLLNFVLLLFSPGVASLPILEFFWFILLLYLIFFSLIFWRDKKKIIFAWWFFLCSIIVWLLFNAWWLLQFIKVLFGSSYLTSEAYTVDSSVGTLKAISESLGNVSYVFRLIHYFYLNEFQKVWGNIYFTPLFIILSYAIPFLAFFPLLIKKKPKILYYFIGLSLLLIFLVKGSRDPFGGIFLFIFSHFRFLEAFRNPFEKFGLALPFAYAPLVGYSLYFLFQWAKIKWRRLRAISFLVVTCFSLFVVLVFPLWNGWVFTSTEPPANNVAIGNSVEVPAYYKEANNWLNTDPDDFRLIALPLGGEGITYTWRYGYNGVELSNALFDRSFISLTTGFEFLKNITTQIQTVLFESPEHFTKTMSILGVKYLMVRSDIDYHLRNMTNPQRITTYISNNSSPLLSDLKYERNFGKLWFYENKAFLPKVYPAKDISIAPVTHPYTDTFSLTDFQIGDVIINKTNDTVFNDITSANAQWLILMPDATVDYSSSPVIPLANAEAQLPYNRFLPGSRFYPLIAFKDKLSAQFVAGDEETFKNLIQLSYKRLGELKKLTELNKETEIAQATKNYSESINDLRKFILRKNKKGLENQYDIIAQKIILQNLLQNNKDKPFVQYLVAANQAIKNLDKEVHVSPVSEPVITEHFGTNRMIYRFTVPTAGEYDLLLKLEDFHSFYDDYDASIEIQLNDTINRVSVRYDKPWLSFGTFHLKKGKNEFYIPVPKAKNIINESGLSEERLVATHEATLRNFPFKAFDPSATYKVAFDYWIEQGGAVDIQLTSDIDTLKKGKTIPGWKLKLEDNGYNHGWQETSSKFTPYLGSSLATFSFVVKPYNDCEKKNAQIIFVVSQCIENTQFYNAYNNTTIFLYKNLTMRREFTDMPVLRLKNTLYKPTTVIPNITTRKTNPANYTITVKDAKKPFILVFSESFHPLWTMMYSDSNKPVSSDHHFLVNSYANAWYITRTGSYTLHLEFSPEKDFVLGKWISACSLLIVISFLCYLFLRKKRKNE